MEAKKVHRYLYNVENWVDEFVIAFLSLGTIVVFLYTVLPTGGNTVSMYSLGERMYPWITMLALMIIGRELWLMNRHMAEGE